MQWYYIYVLLYSLFFVFSFILKTVIQYRRTGINPYRFNKSMPPRQRFLQTYGKFICVAWILSVAGYTIDRPLMEKAGFSLFFDLQFLPFIAVLVSLVALLGLIFAQWQMGYNWRVGIDRENRTELVSRGLFRYIRNPVFSMTLGGLFSLVLFFPGFLTILLWSMSFIGFYLQILEEEKFLLAQHGDQYKRYGLKTGRFLPRIKGVIFANNTSFKSH